MKVTPVLPVESATLPPLGIARNASATAIASAIHAASQWLVLVLIARFGDPALVGRYALAIAVCSPILLLAGLQLRAVQTTDAAHAYHFSEYLALRLVTSVAALILICAAALLFGDGTVIAVIVLVGVSRTIEAVSDVYRGRMHQAERLERVAGSVILRAVGAVAIIASTLAAGAGLTTALALVIVTDLMVWWGWDVRSAGRLFAAPASVTRLTRLFGVAPHLHAPTLARLARTALPLGLVAVLLSLNAYAPQYAVRIAGGDAALGIFAAVLLTASATTVLVGALGLSASPRLARLYQAGRRTEFRALYARLLRFAAVTGALGIAGAILLGRPFLHIAFGAAYADHADLLVLLCAVTALLHIVAVQGYAVTAARVFDGQLPVAALVAAVTATGAFMLVPTYGLRGAAAAMLAGGLVQGVGYTLLLRRALQHGDTTTEAGDAYA